MTGKTPKFYGAATALAISAAFGAGYQSRVHSESGWLPGAPSSPIPLIRTADGNVMADAANGSRLARGDSKTDARDTSGRVYKPSLKPYETLEEVRRDIRDNFVHRNINEEELTYGAIRGMLRSLDDRFTRFLTPADFQKFNEQTDAQFTGIGARIDIKDDYVGSPQARPFNASRPYIVEPIEGGPAEKAGLKKNDVILMIDNRSTAEMSADAVVSYIKGERGSKVTLKIERKLKNGALPRDSVFKIFDLPLTRDVVEVRPVKLEWLPNRIAWIKLDEFNKKSDSEMGEALEALKKGPNGEGAARGLIFDMRDNPGGLLDVAQDIGSRFISDGPIVYTRERDGSEHALNAERDRFMNLKIPIVVMVNNYSASAAEIVTGALKDKGVATVVGEQSYGKASVQVLLTLKNGGALVITTAKYLTPAKRDISDKGIAPDFVVKANEEDEKSGRGAQLDKAIAVIQGKNTTSVATNLNGKQ